MATYYEELYKSTQKSYESLNGKYTNLLDASYAVEQVSRNQSRIALNLDIQTENFVHYSNALELTPTSESLLDSMKSSLDKLLETVSEMEKSLIEEWAALASNADYVYANPESAKTNIHEHRDLFVSRGNYLTGIRELLKARSEQVFKLVEAKSEQKGGWTDSQSKFRFTDEERTAASARRSGQGIVKDRSGKALRAGKRTRGSRLRSSASIQPTGDEAPRIK